MPTAIKIESLSKLYRLGQIGTGTLSHDLNRFWKMRIRGKEDPYSIVGQINDRTQSAAKKEYIWALKNIDLEVKQGEVLGIIGKNGAGKSTLLKILSRITSPTSGSVEINGRLASLLEVGTGFHPEMTGRENVFMNGTIMGMRRWEVKKRLDEIVEFAGVAKYLDTPVKRYSSGMAVRLGFAIAAHLEPEILIVDEVLAVGDAEFQKKAIGKINNVSKNSGRTVLFVSHNMESVKKLCPATCVLDKGEIVYKGETLKAIDFYLEQQMSSHVTSVSWEETNAPGNADIKLLGAKVEPLTGNTCEIENGLMLTFRFKILSPKPNIGNTIFIHTIDDILVMEAGGLTGKQGERSSGVMKTIFKIPANTINNGVFKVHFQTGFNRKYLLYRKENVLIFEINPRLRDGIFRGETGILRPAYELSTIKES